MGSIAGARRTQSSYPRFLASTNPSDVNVSIFTSGPVPPTLTNKIAQLANVKRAESAVTLNVAPLGPDGTPTTAAFNTFNQVATLGSVDGLFFDQDRVTVIHGRMADPTQVAEFVMTADGAEMAGLHVGQVVPLGVYTNAQANSAGFGTPSVHPHLRVDSKLVGIVVLDNEVVQDDIDRLPTFAVFTPALTREVLADSNNPYYGLRLDHGGRDANAVERALQPALPKGTQFLVHVISRVEAQVERAVRPEAIALGVFGALAAFAALFIATQAVSRQLRSGDEDLQVLRALGAGPATTVGDGLVGVLGAVVLGSLLADAVAVGLSPLAPLGPARPVYPSSGVAFDWTVLAVGPIVLIGVLGTIAVLLAHLGAPHRVARRSRLDVARGSSVARMAASLGLSTPGVVGVRFALEPGRGRTSAPVRSALLGTALAVVMVVATLTFGSGLRTLVSRPALYGWNWSYALDSNGNDVPPQALTLLEHDPDVADWTGVGELNTQIDGQNVPVLFGDSRSAVAPPILSGHDVASNNQIVLGAATLAQLHKHVGDTVAMTPTGPFPPFRLLIVGTATMPVLGVNSFIADHTSMGTGALVITGPQPGGVRPSRPNPDPNLNGPELVLVRLRKGVTPTAGKADLQRIADAANNTLNADPNAPGPTLTVLGIQHPAEIVNYRTIGATPVLLASGLAVGAIIALGLTLASSVRRRKRDLALLKTLGFTRRQLAAAVAWQASVAAVIGIAVGVPLGIAFGRQLWILFARSIYAVPEPTVPVVSVILVALGALVFSNLVAALPGRSAAQTPAALVLRTE